MTSDDRNHQISDEASAARPRRFRPAAAALFSLLVPGAGQMYKGQMMHGLEWLVVVKVCYGAGLLVLFLSGAPIGARTLLLLGVFLHIACIVHAATGDGRNGTGAASRTWRGADPRRSATP